MKVSKLIEILSNIDPNIDIKFDDPECGYSEMYIGKNIKNNVIFIGGQYNYDLDDCEIFY